MTDGLVGRQTVSALSIDPSGTRVVSGSYDYDAKLWDFGGMNSEYKPFRSWEIKEGHQVRLPVPLINVRDGGLRRRLNRFTMFSGRWAVILS